LTPQICVRKAESASKKLCHHNSYQDMVTRRFDLSSFVERDILTKEIGLLLESEYEITILLLAYINSTITCSPCHLLKLEKTC